MKKFSALFSILAILILLAGCVSVMLTPLQNAADRGDTNTVKALLDKGADVNEWKYGTALWMAAAKGNADMVKLLIERGADVNVMNQGGSSALGIAAEFGTADIVGILIDKGADVDKAITGLEQRAAFLAANHIPKQVAKVKQGINLIKKIQKVLLNRAGWAHYSNGQYQEAINSFKQTISLEPSNSFNFRGLSASYNALKQYDEAITAAKRAIELKPDNANAYNDLGAAYFHKKQFDEALNAYQKAIEIEPKNATFYAYIGYLFLEREDYSRAADNYKKAAVLAPNVTQPLFNLAATYSAMGRYDDAIASVNKAVELQTFTGTGIGISEIEDGYLAVNEVTGTGPAKKAGIEAGDKIIKVDGKSTKGWKGEQVVQIIKGGALGTQIVLTIERKNFDKPIEKTVTRETIISKGAAAGFGLRSLAYREKGRVEEAYKDAEKAYSLNLDDSWAKSAMSIAYIDKGKYNDALNILSTIKDSLFDRILESIAYSKLGDTKKALEIYGSIPEDYLASKRAPRQSYKKALLESLRPYVNARKESAKLLEGKGQYREALKEYAELLRIADDRDAKEVRNHVAVLIKNNPYLAELPEEARKYALRAEVLLKDGKFEESLNEFNSAVKIAPFAPQLYFNTAFVYGELKNYKSAKRYMNIYIDLYPDAPNIRQVKDEIYKWEFMMEKETEGK